MEIKSFATHAILEIYNLQTGEIRKIKVDSYIYHDETISDAMFRISDAFADYEYSADPKVWEIIDWDLYIDD